MTTDTAIVCSGMASANAIPALTHYLTAAATTLLAINHLLPRGAAKADA